MRPKAIVTILVAGFVFAGGAHARFGDTPGITPAHAQDAKPPQPKGVTSHGLVTSLGPVASFPMTMPVALSGQVVEIAPGGQTGKQRNLAPSFLYVLAGTLVVNTSGGPIGISGIQYHTAGQSYAGPAGVWYNVMNTSQTPARYLIVFIAPPGAKTVELAKAE